MSESDLLAQEALEEIAAVCARRGVVLMADKIPFILAKRIGTFPLQCVEIARVKELSQHMIEWKGQDQMPQVQAVKQ